MNYLLGLVLLLSGCLTPGPQPPSPPPLPEDGGGLPPYSPDAEPVPDVPERAACGRMCKRMEDLKCPLGRPTPVRKEPCVSWCTRMQMKHEIDIHPDCIAKVESCERVKDCD